MDEKESIFREKPLQSLYVPDNLDSCIKCTPFRFWVVAASLALLLAGFLVWAFIGKIPETVSAYGYAITKGNNIQLYLPEAQVGLIKAGDDASSGKLSGKVVSIAETPIDQDAVSTEIGDEFAFDSLNLTEKWNFKVVVELASEAEAKTILSISIVYARITPISYLIG